MKRHPRILAAGLAFAAIAIEASTAHPMVQVPENFVSETIVAGLDLPNSMAFLPDGRLLFTELKSGRVRLLVNGHLAATDPALTVEHLVGLGYERGLQGIAVDPGWPARPYIYVYYTHTGDRCVIARYTGHGDLDSATGENLTFDGRLLLIDDIQDADMRHQAGGLRFGIDGSLFASLGEDEDYCRAPDSTNLLGVLLRLDVSRLPEIADSPDVAMPRALITPPDNPLSTSDTNARLVWAYGMRNPWRFHVDPVTGLIYLADVGEDQFEEINEVHPGQYLGWPWREGNTVIPRPFCTEPGGQGTIDYAHPIVALRHGPHDTAIFSAGPYRPVAGATDNWPASYWGDVFYGDYFMGFMRRIRKTGDTWGPAPVDTGQPDPVNWATGLFGAVDFLVGPDGSLWWMRQTSDDEETLEGTGSIGRIRAFRADTVDTATEVTLVHSIATPHHVQLEWYVPDSGVTMTLERRQGSGPWLPLAELRSDGDGRIEYEDRAISPGATYDYRVAARVEGSIRYFAETRIEVPTRLELAVQGIRPQPGRERLMVAFSLPATGAVRLEILDVAGRRVFERDLGVLEAGNQLVRLPALNLDSGFYVTRVSQGGKSAMGRAVIAR
jgi:glucose/arabinose dehydrogenase